MSETDDDIILERDADLSTPLRRVSYEAGMLLGLEATRDEQTYHRQRINRQQYWAMGAGTLVGMLVSISPDESESDTPILTRMNVGPGVGIDGLGREINIHEGYCVNLGEWLQAQSETELRNGYDEDEDLLWLNVSVRYHACEVAQQPVLARKLNLSTDAVQPSRIADSILLEMIPELPPEGNESYKPWKNHPSINDDLPELNTDEQLMLDNAAGNVGLHRQLHLQARLLHAMDGNGVDTELTSTELQEGARILLARVSISMENLDGILNSTAGDPVVNPSDIEINNLVRPFLHTPSQLAYIERSV